MRSSTTRALSLCVLVALVASANAKIKGMAFSTGTGTITGGDLSRYRSTSADQSMKQLKESGANYIQISTYAKMSSLTALTTTPVSDVDSIRFIVQKSKKEGFKVFLKPVIEPAGAWRGFIPGGGKWFRKAYLPFIMKWAKVAQEENVEIFSVGSEMVTTVNQTYQWLRVIRRVKQVYKGKTTYVANHDAYFNVKFFHKLTFISISAYFKFLPGETGYSPNLAWTIQKWNQTANTVVAWRRKNKIKRPVLLAEVGMQSKGNGVVYRVPWDWDNGAPLNFYEQVKMYEGLLGAFMPRKWCAGVMLWHWELDPNAGFYEPGIRGYTPQNKPALKVMEKYFKREY